MSRIWLKLTLGYTLLMYTHVVAHTNTHVGGREWKWLYANDSSVSAMDDSSITNLVLQI